MKRIFEWLIAFSLGLGCIWLVAMWQTRQMWSLQKIYPIQATTFRLFNDCSNSAPHWMRESIHHAIGKQGGISAQLAYIGANGDEFHCEIGVTGKNLLEPINKDHRYRYASNTKLVTAAAIIHLAAESKLNLSDSMLAYFPEVTELRDERIRDIKLHHLLNHQAGFDRVTLLGDPMFMRDRKPWCPQNIKLLKHETLTNPVGTKINYSNLGYCLLGEVITRVTGVPYKEYINKYYDLERYNIKFIGAEFSSDEVKYDYRFESDYSETYLNQFDFNAISSSAGLSGSAISFARLLKNQIVPSIENALTYDLIKICQPEKASGCYRSGRRIYAENDKRLILQLHEGYLPGSVSVAIIDGLGGVTVLTKSGADRPQLNPNDEWVPWFYNQLNNYYLQQGLL